MSSVISSLSFLKNTCISFLFILSWLTPARCQKTVIFDLGGVLFSKKSSFALVRKHVGLKIVIAYALRNGTKAGQIKKTVFQLLNELKPRSTASPVPAYDDHGDPLPLLMQEWLEGSLTSKEVLEFITEKSSTAQQLFRTKSEKIIFLRIARLIFDPHLFIQTQELHPEAVDLIKKLKTEGYKLYVLSNWDAESFTLLKEYHKDLFDLFDGISISADFKCSKPSPQLYDAFLSFHRLHPSECIFIDDQLINITGATNAGIPAFICPQNRPTFFGKKKANLHLVYTLIRKVSIQSSQLV